MITVCKQKKYDQITKIYNEIIKIKEFNHSLSKIINDEKNEIVIVHELCKKLSKNGYIIISINPLKIKHK